MTSDSAVSPSTVASSKRYDRPTMGSTPNTTKRRLPFLVAGAFCLPEFIAAQEPIDLAWISGPWCVAYGEERIEEYWLSPAGGVLLGVARTLKGGKLSSFEYLRIVNEGGVPAYVAQPNGNAPTTFRRTAGGPNWVRFENPAHDTRVVELGARIRTPTTGAAGGWVGQFAKAGVAQG
jgi:hypothetical protein